MSLPSCPYTIDNGAGEWLTFTRRGSGARGERIEAETRVAPGAGPPMHAHLGQDEGFTVLEGVMGYQVAGQEARYATAGESVVFQAGEPHRFWNAGEAELRCSGYIEPAGNAEYLLRAVFASQLANGGKRPSLFDVAFLMRRYRSEFVMTAVPRPLQAALFPPLVLLGRLLGRYRKYADAPPPA